MAVVIDSLDVDKAIYTVVNVAAVQAALGNPVRLYTWVKPTVTFPFVRMNQVGIPPTEATLNAGVPSYFWRYLVDFVAFSQSRSADEAANIIKLISEEVLDRTKYSLTNGSVIGVIPRGSPFNRYEPDDETWTAVASFDMRVVNTT